MVYPPISLILYYICTKKLVLLKTMKKLKNMEIKKTFRKYDKIIRYI